MATNYLNPKIIHLDRIDFEKLDISPGTSKFLDSDFAILNAGHIFDLSIIVDRDNEQLIKSCSGLEFSNTHHQTKFAEDVSGISTITGISDNGLTQSNKIMHENILNSNLDFESTIKGILFAKMVSTIFNVSDSEIAALDFTNDAQRDSQIFFDNDSTANVPNDIKLKTVGLDVSGNFDVSGIAVFNQTITNWFTDVSGHSIMDSEVSYWNTRTEQDSSGNETESVLFNQSDKIMVMYAVSTSFIQGDHDSGIYKISIDNLTAFRTATESPIDAGLELASGIADSNYVTRFILEYNVNPITNYLTGHKFTDPTYASWSDRPTGSLRAAVDQWIDGSWDESVGGHISTWDTSEVTDFSELFRNLSTFNEDLSHWDVSNATDMSYMFNTCNSFNQDIGDWDVSNVKNMKGVLYNGAAFNQNLNKWNTYNVTNMSAMFYGCSNFDHPLNDWQTDNVTDMSVIFTYASSFNQPLNPPPNGGWEVGQVTTMNSMFSNASSFNQDISTWNTSGLSAFGMYDNCPIDPLYKAPNT